MTSWKEAKKALVDTFELRNPFADMTLNPFESILTATDGTLAVLTGQGPLRKVLIAEGGDEAFDSRRADGCRARVGHRGIGAAVMHRGADFNARRKAIENQPSGLLLKNGNQLLVRGQIFFRAVNRHR